MPVIRRMQSLARHHAPELRLQNRFDVLEDDSMESTCTDPFPGNSQAAPSQTRTNNEDGPTTSDQAINDESLGASPSTAHVPWKDIHATLGKKQIHMEKSHCMSRHTAWECSRGRAKKMATEPDEMIIDQAAADVVEGKAFSFLSMIYFWNVQCLVVGCLVRRLSHRRQQMRRWIFFHRWAACSSTRSTERLGTTATFLLFKAKAKNLCHSWKQLAWLLRQAEVAPKRAAKSSFGSGNRSHIPTDFVVHRTPLKRKSSLLSNHKQLAQLVYVKH